LLPQRHAAGEEDENFLPHRHAAAHSAMNITIATNVRPCFANDTHVILPCRCNVSLCDFKYFPCFVVLISASFILGCKRRELAAPLGLLQPDQLLT
jgi:hypothetical protein